MADVRRITPKWMSLGQCVLHQDPHGMLYDVRTLQGRTVPSLLLCSKRPKILEGMRAFDGAA